MLPVTGNPVVAHVAAAADMRRVIFGQRMNAGRGWGTESSRLSLAFVLKLAARQRVWRVSEPCFPVLHAIEKSNLQQTIDRTCAAIGTLGMIVQELRLIRKGMAPTAEKTRLDEMVRLARDVVSGLERKLPLLRRELSKGPAPGRRQRATQAAG